VFETLASFGQRLIAEVRGPGAKHIECDECRGRGSALEILEADGLALRVERDDLAVEDD
jgi:hypothetical protein